LDTGASVSLIKENVVPKIAKRIGYTGKVVDANGKRLPITGKVKLNVKTYGSTKVLPTTFLITLDETPLPAPILIGMNILTYAEVRFGRKSFKLDEAGEDFIEDDKSTNGELTMNLGGFLKEKPQVETCQVVQENDKFLLHTEEDIMLEPTSNVILEVPVPKQHQGSNSPIIINRRILNNGNVLVASTVGHQKGGKVPIMLLNTASA